MGDQAVVPDERNDVRDRRERGDVVKLFARLQAAHLLYEPERDARAAQRLERVLSLREMWVEDGAIGQFSARLMVVCDQHLEAEFVLRIIDLVDRRYAAVNADQDVRVALLGDLVERGIGDAVAVLAAVGDEVGDVRAARFEIEQEYGRSANAVAVIVSEDDDALSVRDRALQPVGDLGKPVVCAERRERVERRVQKCARRRLVVNAACDQQLCDERVYAEFLGERLDVHKKTKGLLEQPRIV